MRIASLCCCCCCCARSVIPLQTGPAAMHCLLAWHSIATSTQDPPPSKSGTQSIHQSSVLEATDDHPQSHTHFRMELHFQPSKQTTNSRTDHTPEPRPQAQRIPDKIGKFSGFSSAKEKSRGYLIRDYNSRYYSSAPRLMMGKAHTQNDDTTAGRERRHNTARRAPFRPHCTAL